MKKIMQRFMLFAFVILVGNGIAAQDSNKPLCEKFKTGTFRLDDEKNNVHTLVKRTATHQTEYDLNNKGSFIKFEIEWVSECEYVLVKPIKYKKVEDMYKFFMDKKLHVRITESSGDDYTFVAKFKDFPQMPEVSTTMKKIK